MSSPQPTREVAGLSPSLVGLVLGVSLALPMYLWQTSIQLAVASFVIVGYTSWLWTVAHNHSVMNGLLSAELRKLPINVAWRRALRMLVDPGVWWTTTFGVAVVSGSVWFAGLKDNLVVIGIGSIWCLIAASLNYGMTLVHPSSRCRRCGYDLKSQIAQSVANNVIPCPECGARWSRAQLGQVETVSTMDWRNAA